MKVDRAKKLAAEIKGVGTNKIRLKAEGLEEISKAITREDIKGALAAGNIIILPEVGTSRGRARVRHARKKKGRYRKAGKKKGTKKARTPKKRAWIIKVRALRKLLVKLKGDVSLDSKTHRSLYRRIKGNWFRDKKHLDQFVKESKK